MVLNDDSVYWRRPTIEWIDPFLFALRTPEWNIPHCREPSQVKPSEYLSNYEKSRLGCFNPMGFLVYQDTYRMKVIPGGCSDRVRSTSRNQVHLLVGKNPRDSKKDGYPPNVKQMPRSFFPPEAREFSYLNASGRRTAGHFEVRWKAWGKNYRENHYPLDIRKDVLHTFFKGEEKGLGCTKLTIRKTLRKNFKWNVDAIWVFSSWSYPSSFLGMWPTFIMTTIRKLIYWYGNIFLKEKKMVSWVCSRKTPGFSYRRDSTSSSRWFLFCRWCCTSPIRSFPQTPSILSFVVETISFPRPSEILLTRKF